MIGILTKSGVEPTGDWRRDHGVSPHALGMHGFRAVLDPNCFWCWLITNRAVSCRYCDFQLWSMPIWPLRLEQLWGVYWYATRQRNEKGEVLYVPGDRL